MIQYFKILTIVREQQVTDLYGNGNFPQSVKRKCKPYANV